MSWRTWAGWIVGLALVAGGAFAAHRLERRVHATPALREPPRFRLIDAPAGLDDQIEKYLAALQDLVWIDGDVCQRVAGVLAQNGWVRQVRAVRKIEPPFIEISCDYRTPAAMVSSTSGDFFLVDAGRVRLPGQYRFHPSLMRVDGVSGAPPAAGEVWAAPELAAALAIIGTLEREPFRDQIVGVRVTNYRGRVDRRAPRIELLTDARNGRIIWGSAPGEEVEENSVPHKLAILRANFAANGRADANLPVIDIATLPGRYTIHALTDAADPDR